MLNHMHVTRVVGSERLVIVQPNVTAVMVHETPDPSTSVQRLKSRIIWRGEELVMLNCYTVSSLCDEQVLSLL
jgi:hypothetical protein